MVTQTIVFMFLTLLIAKINKRKSEAFGGKLFAF
jgi:hypothetical protein